ncbi:MAG TPA: DegT/DnrJ/EryC1/StrS family aminotransferase [Anaerolineales bacterium]|nr:DegT/DnrJ/EryC1/StrS family aminotransferase [Anaerolineales bacterium]
MIPLVDLTAQYRSIKDEIDAAVASTLASGHFILGPQVVKFEESVASYLGASYAVGLASGTDALVIALRALDIGVGDEVIVPAYTFFATAGAVMSVGAKPVFVDIDSQTYQIDTSKIERAITPKTKAIIPVHLYGHPSEMKPILEIARKHNLKVIEDNAQAFGAEYLGNKTGTLGDIGCLSFFPTKNLGAYGDGGMVVTHDAALAERMRMLRTHGWKKKYYSEEIGYNSRLDALQAAILQAKLPHVEAWNERRRELAKRYSEYLAPLGMTVPVECEWGKHVYHLYIIRTKQRDALQAFLKEKGIASEVYYPLPPHLAIPCRRLGYQEGDFPQAELASRETLALPLYPELTLEQQDQIIEAVREFEAQ